MFGIKKKTASKTSYPETFYVNLTLDLMTRDNGDETFEVVRRLKAYRPYKGRYVTPTRIELEEFKGVILKEAYFSDSPKSWG